ncbi:hypothetical protein NQ315_011920 [Exocentrus adspersus]|uniref:Major facilitator superfamily (MFS) profile domain-containing protein n=1 Tax=Exocentrus adspersus TaxID=1586481 RepID=A0AAV8W0Z7_9CUCU|nr:hypothetical protein NQ315_011920 [Exocentrus adspersus]
MLKASGYTLLSVFIVNLLATSGDITLSWTSPIYIQLYSRDPSINPLGRPITDDEDGWLGSLLTIGAIVGPLPFSLIAEKFGRKIALLCIAVPHIISYIVMAFARNIYLFYFGRIFGGLALGGGYTLLPMYITEISEDHNRGMMSLSLNIFWALGNFLPYAIGPFMSIMWFNLVLACIPTAFFIIFLVIGSETPYYLLGANKIEQAETSLVKLRSLSNDVVQKELEFMKAHLKDDEDSHFSDILRKAELRKALVICVFLIVAQAMSGYCAITFYLQPIFEAAGTSLSSDISALIVGSTMFLSSFVAPVLVDRLGRKILTIFSCFGTFVSLVILGSFFYVQDFTILDSDPINWMPIFSLILYILTFNFGLGSIPWILSSELFPNSVKQIAASTVSSTFWITSFLLTRFFNDMNDVLGKAGSFWFFAIICLAAALFSIIYMPETKGKSFSEIQEMLRSGNKDFGKEEGLHPEKF